MKKTLLFTFLLVSSFISAQAPSGYYNSAQGLTGYTLKSELSQIISFGHNPQSYGDLWDAYYDSDVDVYYENDGSVLDIYSENPNGSDPYNYNLGTDQCGDYSGEGSCYNREHLFPKSWFNDQYPMYTDIHHIYPTDGHVNNQRSNFPFGEVNSPSWTSNNGTKKGNNSYSSPGAYTGTVFEPIDEFKGDVARVYFYMATRYESQIAGWENHTLQSDIALNGTSDQVFEDWMLEMFIEWHNNDPVSQKEIDRNNEAYYFQGNRNPYIDHPEWVMTVWQPDLKIKTTETFQFSIYPNPVSKGNIHIDIPSADKFSYKIYDINGRLLQQQEQTPSQEISVDDLATGLYIIQINVEGKSVSKKLIIN